MMTTAPGRDARRRSHYRFEGFARRVQSANVVRGLSESMFWCTLKTNRDKESAGVVGWGGLLEQVEPS